MGETFCGEPDLSKVPEAGAGHDPGGQQATDPCIPTAVASSLLRRRGAGEQARVTPFWPPTTPGPARTSAPSARDDDDDGGDAGDDAVYALWLASPCDASLPISV